MTIPPAVRGWFASQYPTVSFDETWLESCVDFLQVRICLCVCARTMVTDRG